MNKTGQGIQELAARKKQYEWSLEETQFRQKRQKAQKEDIRIPWTIHVTWESEA